MPATTCCHHRVPKAILHEADVVLDDPGALHPATRLFNPTAAGREPTMPRVLTGRELPSSRCFLRVADHDPRRDDALDALSLRATAARWQGVACPLGQALLRRVALTGVAPDAHVTGLMAHEAVGARGARRRATVIRLVRVGRWRAVERPFGASMPQRGVVALASAACVANSAAHAAVVRAGSHTWFAQA